MTAKGTGPRNRSERQDAAIDGERFRHLRAIHRLTISRLSKPKRTALRMATSSKRFAPKPRATSITTSERLRILRTIAVEKNRKSYASENRRGGRS